MFSCLVICWQVDVGRFKRDWTVLDLIAIWNRQLLAEETNAKNNEEDGLDHQLEVNLEQSENELAEKEIVKEKDS